MNKSFKITPKRSEQSSQHGSIKFVCFESLEIQFTFINENFWVCLAINEHSSIPLNEAYRQYSSSCPICNWYRIGTSDAPSEYSVKKPTNWKYFKWENDKFW